MKFTKMQGAGNDFLLFDGYKYKLEDIVPNIKKMCDRRFGVGGDGIMVALPSDVADIKMYYYNSDGSQGEMCGNGIRCFSKFIYEKGLVSKTEIEIETLAGIQHAILHKNENNKIEKVEIEIGNIKYLPEEVPALVEGNNVFRKELSVDGKKIEFSSVFLGVPHTVIFIKSEEEYDINKIGAMIECHKTFPKKTNVNFVLVERDNKIKIFTWERGAGRTLACGTGSCSSALLGNKLGYLKDEVEVITEGGTLYIKVLENSVKLIGGAEITFEGEIAL